MMVCRNVFVLKFAHQERFDEAINISIHNTLNISGLEIRPMVFDTTVVKNIRPYLISPTDVSLAVFEFLFRFIASIKFFFIKNGLQQTDSIFLVFRLVSRLGVLDLNLFVDSSFRVGIHIIRSNTTIHFVDILTTSTTTAEIIKREFSLIEFHGYRIIDYRTNEN